MRATVIVGLVLLAAQPALRSQDSLNAAKDLYASAAFEEALSILSRLDGGAANAPDIDRQIDEYRAFCLYALGRTAEAESILESIIRKEPMTRLDAADASPRIETMFTNVRKRLLPSLIRERFQAVRGALNKNDFGSAEPHLAEARLMITEAENLGVKDEGLADLGVLVDGFLQMIRSTAEERRTSPARTASPPADAAVVAAPPQPEPLPAPAEPGDEPIYSVADEGVSPPVALNQHVPSMTQAMLQITRSLRTSGILEIVIDENGAVVDTIVRRSLTPSFDTLLVRAAHYWKYRPAMKDGVPVRYVKTLVIVPPR
jgi:hypothetical protein